MNAQLLDNDKWDDVYCKNLKKKKDQRKRNSDANDGNATNDNNHAQLSQTKGKKSCYCCGKEGHLSPDCPKQHTIDKKDWFMKRAINAHQQEGNGNQGANTTNENSGNNNNNSGSNDGNSRSVQWNNPVSTQSFQTRTTHVQNTQVQLHQLAVNHNQQFETANNDEPVDFKKDALIDTWASFSSLVNAQLLDDVVMAEEPMTMGTNAGNKTLRKHGESVGFEAKMWKDTTGIANVLSFVELTDQCHTTHNNAIEDTFHMREWDDCDEGIKFPRNHASNLCHFRFSDAHLNQDEQNDVQSVETVTEN